MGSAKFMYCIITIISMILIVIVAIYVYARYQKIKMAVMEYMSSNG